VLLGKERGMSVTQSSCGSASGYQVVHRSRDFPLDNPGIVSIPLAFFLGSLGSVTDRRPSDPARFARIQVRALTGVGAERGGHN
jgi:Na+(H+)/acetate symporter ActP